VDIAQAERDREIAAAAERAVSAATRFQEPKNLTRQLFALARKNEVISALKQRLLSATRSTHHEIQTVSRDLLRVIDEHVRGGEQMEGVTKQLSDFHQEFIAKLSAEFGVFLHRTQNLLSSQTQSRYERDRRLSVCLLRKR
jgi:uncharacterized protein involved in exopolysaccharide biosynthesis